MDGIYVDLTRFDLTCSARLETRPRELAAMVAPGYLAWTPNKGTIIVATDLIANAH